MFDFCGQRLRVFKRAHKTCDTVNKTGGRRLDHAVHLEGVRCDGVAYGGCDAACLIFWRDEWLVPVSGPNAARDVTVALHTDASLDDRQVLDATRAPGSLADDPTYSCQATRLPAYTRPLPWWDARQYLEDVTSRNVRLRELLGGLAYAVAFTAVRVARRLGVYEQATRLYDRFQTARGGVPYPRRWGTVEPGIRTPRVDLHVEPGDLVRVRTYPEILATLDGANKNRGLYFDAEEVPYCGGQFRVRSHVRRIVDERTGKLVEIGGGTVILDDVWCMAHYSDRRMFCPRAIYSFWRETWLEPVEGRDSDRTSGSITRP
jgi:hypothetical protein